MFNHFWNDLNPKELNAVFSIRYSICSIKRGLVTLTQKANFSPVCSDVIFYLPCSFSGSLKNHANTLSLK